MTRSNERKLEVFERRSLRENLGPKTCVKKTNENQCGNYRESKDLYDEANIAGI